MGRSDEGGAPPRGKTVQLSTGHEIHYQEAGEGPAVLFLHGSGPGASGYSNFKQNYRVLADAGYRAIVPDMVGFGWSSKPEGVDYTLDLFTSTMIEFMGAVGVTRATLVGNSLGGAVSFGIALDRPDLVDKLVLMGPGGIETREVYFRMEGIQKMVSEFTGQGFTPESLGRLLQLIVYDPRHVTPELVAERFAVLQTQPKDVLARMIIPDLSPRLGELKMPILGFWGLEDRFCPSSGAEKVVTACDNSRFVTFARCGHWAMVEHADTFNRYVVDFLRNG